MTILFIIRSLGNGGAERQLSNLAVKLKEYGYSIYIVTFYKGGIYEDYLAENDVQVICLNKKSRWNLIPFFDKLSKTVKCVKPDIVHGYLPTGNILAILAKAFYPKLKVVFGIRSANMDLSKYDLVSRLSYKIEIFLSRYANLIITNSNAGKTYLISHGVSEEKICAIPNGIDTKHFRVDRSNRKRLRADLGIKENTFLVGLIGRIDPMKDHTTFLKAASILLKRRNDINFLCVGGNSQSCNKMIQLSCELELTGKVFWVGERKDMLDIYNCLDILCSSSVSEGFSNVIAEGMSCGIPCVVTDVGDSSWIVGSTGIVVSPCNQEQLADGINKMLDSDFMFLGMKARERIVQNFNIDDLAVRTINVFRCLH